jgi:methionine-rich copper-binding protein CopC
MNAMNQYVVRGLMATLLFVLYLCLAPSSSSAHAYPDHADPKVGSTVKAAPSSVRIWFDGDLEPVFSTIHVQNQRGENVDKGNGRVNAIDPTLLEASVPLLPPGTYRVLWNVVARGGHRTTGNLSFTVK